MFAFITTFLFFLAEATHSTGSEGGFTHFYNEYLNIPGFEAWKFLNLGLFIALMVYLTRKPLGEAFRARRDQIRSELIRAEEEKKAALERLTSAEAKVAQLEAEKQSILTKAKEEAEIERKRIEEQTAADAERLRQQTESELARLQNQSRAELRRYSAEESIQLAEQKLRAAIDGSTDARLVKASIQEIGGLN
jgi:F0F1-type ATP synthase membrane subunit b/b'